MAAPVTAGANFDPATPVALFQATPWQSVSSRDLFVYDVSRAAISDQHPSETGGDRVHVGRLELVREAEQMTKPHASERSMKSKLCAANSHKSPSYQLVIKLPDAQVVARPPHHSPRSP